MIFLEAEPIKQELFSPQTGFVTPGFNINIFHKYDSLFIPSKSVTDS